MSDDDLVDHDNAELTMIAGAVIERDYVYIAQHLDKFAKVADETEFSVLSQVDVSDVVDPWGAHVSHSKVVSVCVWDDFPDARRAYVALSDEGQVELMGPGGDPLLIEQIEGAGLSKSWSGGLGYLSCVRAIGRSLYACGGANQVYRRTPEHPQWQLISGDILVDPQKLSEREDAMLGIRHLIAIGGHAEDNIYAVGIQGAVVHFDGKHWRELKCPTSEHLTAICIHQPNDIFIAGSQGTLLRGNASEGFVSVWPTADDVYFTGIASHGGLVYLSSVRRGLYVFDPATGNARSYQTKLMPEFLDPHHLEARDGVLWCFGHKDLAWFNGDAWHRVQHPDNAPIG